MSSKTREPKKLLVTQTWVCMNCGEITESTHLADKDNLWICNRYGSD